MQLQHKIKTLIFKKKLGMSMYEVTYVGMITGKPKENAVQVQIVL